MKAKMVWPCLKVFWFSKDNPTGHSDRKKKKRQTEEEVGRRYQRVDRNGLCQLMVDSINMHQVALVSLGCFRRKRRGIVIALASASAASSSASCENFDIF